LSGGLERLSARITGLMAPMTAAERATTPPGGGWSADQIAEHLCLANGDYLREMHAAVGKAGAPRSGGDWHPTLGGRMLVYSMESRMRFPAPRAIVPGPEAREGVLDALLATHDRLLRLLDNARTREWRTVRFRSPYARWMPLNLGDGALIILRHGERHARQMERVVASVGRRT